MWDIYGTPYIYLKNKLDSGKNKNMRVQNCLRFSIIYLSKVDIFKNFEPKRIPTLYYLFMTESI